jgi:hypothetical protein
MLLVFNVIRSRRYFIAETSHIAVEVLLVVYQANCLAHTALRWSTWIIERAHQKAIA